MAAGSGFGHFWAVVCVPERGRAAGIAIDDRHVVDDLAVVLGRSRYVAGSGGMSWGAGSGPGNM